MSARRGEDETEGLLGFSHSARAPQSVCLSVSDFVVCGPRTSEGCPPWDSLPTP